MSERIFDRVPRLKRSKADAMGMAWFHGRDNPYGHPDEVWLAHKDDAIEKIKEKCYGVAYKQFGARFRKFNRKIHVIPASMIPKVGINRHVVDPSKGRNYVNAWFRQTRNAHYLYREWPNRVDYVEGVGVMGNWAEPDGKRMDGRPGEGQIPIGWGLMDYLEMWARYEGWPDGWQKRMAYFGYEGGNGKGDKDVIHTRMDFESVDDGSKERVVQRIIDSRAASEPKTNQESMRYTTLQSEFGEMGVWFDLAPGNQIATGINMIVDALSYDDNAPVSYENAPEFYISEECVNSIFSMETWTGVDGNKGACKDFIDLMRYYFESKPMYDDRLVSGGEPRGGRRSVRRSAGSPY